MTMHMNVTDSTTYEQLEDSVLTRALMITLRNGDLTPPGKVYLPHVAQVRPGRSSVKSSALS